MRAILWSPPPGDSGVTQSLVLTLIGSDRPGLVEALSQTVADHSANWLESRLARLAGRFAGVLRVDVPDGNAEQLVTALEALASHGLKVVVEVSAEDEPSGEFRPMRLDLVGNDRPGIIHEISQALARRGVNVDELHTECRSAPMSGDMLFHANADLGVPPGLAVETLRDELERIAQDLIVDIQLGEVDDALS